MRKINCTELGRWQFNLVNELNGQLRYLISPRLNCTRRLWNTIVVLLLLLLLFLYRHDKQTIFFYALVFRSPQFFFSPNTGLFFSLKIYDRLKSFPILPIVYITHIRAYRIIYRERTRGLGTASTAMHVTSVSKKNLVQIFSPLTGM